MRTLLTLFSAAALLSAARAQIVSPSIPPLRPPVVWVDPKLQPMMLEAADIAIHVRGHLATTRMDLTFANPNGRVIEGELVFPLGEGQSVSGYELEVDGKMRRAVSVPKHQAREVFESVVRRGIDPGLAELTKGNVFRTRLYPIPARGVKRVAVSFEQELTDTGKGFRFVLPLGWKEKIARFHARVEVVKQTDIPLTDAKESEPLTFEKWNDSFTAELKREDFKPEKPLAFIVPKRADTPVVFTVTDALEPAEGWFTARTEAAPPAPPAPAPVAHAAVFYDASGSAQARDREREFAFIAAWIKARGVQSVDLVVFRNEAEPVQVVAVPGGDAAPLIGLLKALPLDGGTSLGAVDVAAVPQAAEVLLVSDGMSNFGPSAPKLTRPGAPMPVITVHAAQAADHVLLQHLAAQTGGRAVNLVTTAPEDAAKRVSSGVFRFLGAKVLSGEAKDIVPGGPAEVAGGFSIAGRFKGRTEIELSFGYSPEAAVTQRIVLDPTAALEPERGEFIRRVWAQKRVAELLPDPKKNEAFIAQTGRDFGIVTPFNSLLVLERIEDYAEHGIEPPEPELRERWQKLMGDMKKQRRPQQVRDHLAELIKEWREFREWHGKRHPWLETVLAPAAKREAGIIRQLVKAGKSKGLTAAEADLAATIAESAQGLAQRWRQEGADPAARPAWEKEAVETMLKLDALRQKRIAAAPESEAAASEHAQELYGLSRPRREAGDAAADPFSSGSAPSAPAPAPPPAPAADRTSPGAPRMAPSRGEGRGGFDTGRGLAPAKAGEDAEAPAADSGLSAGIEIKPWTPNAAYLKALRKAPDAYAAYLKERAANARSSAFFLDCADFFRDEKKDARLALRVLSNLAEMDYESAPLLRILAARLQQTGRYDLAVPMLEEVLAMRPEEPQSRRDLALALSRQSAPDFSRSIALLWEVAGKPWDNRFSGIGLIALHELHAVLASCPQDGRPDMKSLNIPAELMEPVETGLRVVLTWDADATDIDLWVTDPAGETVMYNHNRGKTGGHVSNDFTQGYGPEVFTIRRPLPGTYTVRINYYGNRQQKFAGATTVQVEFQTAFGKADAKREAITRRLTDQREIIEVGRFTWKPTPLP